MAEDNVIAPVATAAVESEPVAIVYDNGKYPHIKFDIEKQADTSVSPDRFPAVMAHYIKSSGLPGDKAQDLFDHVCSYHNTQMGNLSQDIKGEFIKYTEGKKAEMEAKIKADHEARQATISKEFGDERQKIVDHARSKAKGFGFEGAVLDDFVNNVNDDPTTLRFIKNYMSEYKDTNVALAAASKPDKEHGSMRDIYEFSKRGR